MEPLAGWFALQPPRAGQDRHDPLRRTRACGNPAPGSVIEIKIGAKNDGTITAIQARMIFDSGCYPGTPVEHRRADDGRLLQD